MSVQATPIRIIKTGAKPQQILNSVSLGATVSSPTDYLVNCDGDALGLVLTISITGTKGTGIYASTASVLSAINELIIKNVYKRTLHDFKAPAQLPFIAFMFDDYYGKGGKYIADTAISADGTVVFSRRLWGRINANDFPLTFTFTLAALSTEYSTVGTGTITLSVTVTPIKSGTYGQVITDVSQTFAMSGLSATNNDVTAQLIERSNVAQMAFTVGTESHLTDVTLITPEIEMLSVPTQSMTDDDESTISGHQTGFFRLIFRGNHVTLSKNGTTMKFNESTADNPTIYLIGQ